MRRLILLFLVSVFSQVSLWAADTPSAEIFGGFSVLTAASGGSRVTPLGWQGSIAGSLSDHISLVGDIGGQYKNSAHIYEYLGGVKVASRQDALTIFGHALYGAATGGGGGATAVTSFMMGYGGGLDLKASNGIAIRAIQFDWLPSRTNGSWLNNQLRFGFGLVFLSE
ncbi:MAG TPA: hypothetical protein VFY29_06170 [Terriglobia bacterium]|nr:hypothetical protein [Terriglobia bacterium]